MSHQSPFEDPANPFQDPSITNALNSQNVEESFSETSHEQTTKSFTETSFHHVSDNRDPYSSSTTDLKADAATASREEALRQKERELAERERDLDERQRRAGQVGGPNNFPPCFPIMYLDIPAEIPVQHQQTVWWIYREWLLFEITLVLNFIACLCVLFSHPDSVTSGPADVGIALTEMFTHTLASFFLWYRPVYNAYMKDTSLYYFLFLVFNGFHVLYTFYMAVGIPSTGGAGLILLVTLFTEHYWVTGVLTLLASICWLTMGFMAIYLYKRVYDQYKAAGHTFSEAKNEAYGHIGRSSTVRNAAMNAAVSSATRR
ncbi:scamp-domain-containing protein [Backusella circina FSU 941]|nr:scamp-domain-containing protein [Backusella circina FSU 941]